MDGGSWSGGWGRRFEGEGGEGCGVGLSDDEGELQGYESIRLKFVLMHQSGVIVVISC